MTKKKLKIQQETNAKRTKKLNKGPLKKRQARSNFIPKRTHLYLINKDLLEPSGQASN